MILEFLEYLLTPCTRTARAMGFVKSTIQVRSRYHRCKNAWKPHLQRTRAAILAAAERAPSRRKALLFGAGMLHDIPLSELAATFEEVVLADIVHSLPVRYAVRRLPNVRLLPLDVTGVVESLATFRKHPDAPLPDSRPRAFLEDDRLDFTVSVNLLSQLGWVPGLFLRGLLPATAVAAFQKDLVSAHLDYLGSLPGLTSLITDVRWRAQPHAPEVPHREWGVLHGVQLPEPEWEWDWSIAPAPERERDTDYTARVYAYGDWKESVQTRGPGRGNQQ